MAAGAAQYRAPSPGRRECRGKSDMAAELATVSAGPAPLVAGGKTRGSAEAARRIASDPAALQAARARVRQKFFAKNVEATKASKLALAEDLAARAGVTPLYPLSEDALLAVAAALDAASFRSAAGYLSELRLRHIELDFAVSPCLARTFKKVCDAVSRGIGPPAKAPEVQLKYIDHGIVTKVVGAADAYVAAEHWLLRADEVAALRCSTVSVLFHADEGSADVTLRLSTSKTDQHGNAARRRLACLCRAHQSLEGAPLPQACPACAVRRQADRLWSQFGWRMEEASDHALFPLANGATATKAQIVDAWGFLATSAEKPSGHSPRRSGAKRYARAGWSVWMIQFMGRWATSTVLEYIEEAMAEMTSSWSLGGSSSSSRPAGNAGSSGGCPRIGDRLDRMEQLLEEVQARAAAAGTANQETARITAQLAKQASCQRVVWRMRQDASAVHLVAEAFMDLPASAWTTVCGWKFGQSDVTLRKAAEPWPAGKSACTKCTARIAPEAVGEGFGARAASEYAASRHL